ncbi:hypothetical protein Tco_0773300 [Tanacetum coccineum]|uniref:Uncharacterized protein n=1 Tax=Tanacetum coccineum TaxID=301880 RepID=A0ABQ4ZKC2_9ASTR
MTTTAAQQVPLDNVLVPLEKRVEIGKCNMRIDPAKTLKEPTYQVEIGKCNMRIDATILICPRLSNKDFDELPSDDEIVSFIKELRHKGYIKSVTVVGMFYKKKLDFVELLWEDFTFQIENRDHKKQEKMYYPRFTKAIIHYFISKDKSISMRNRMFMHTARDDSILGLMRFVSRSDDFQVYVALLPKRMTNQQMQDSDAYKTYIAYATGEASPKMKRKLKKPATKRQSAGGDSYDEENEQSDGKEEQSDDDHEQVDDERIESDNEEEETQDDEYVHTPDDYVPTDDETKDKSDDVIEEEYERINEELYGDVNISLKDVKPADKEKYDEEMTVASHVNVNQEGVGNQVKDDAQATRKTEGPIPSSSISSDYAAKYLNFDNIPPVDTEVDSMLDINVQHEVPHTLPLFTILVSVILEHTVVNPSEIVTTTSSTTISSLPITNLEKDVKELKTVDHSAALLSTIKSEVPNAVKEYLGTSLDDALYKVLKKHDADIIKEHSVLAKIVERLRQQYVPEKSTEDIRKIKMEHARKQQLPKETITLFDTTALEEFD